jgi:hypothetical protein
LDAAWRASHPRILGALLDLAARVASVLPSVRLESTPRMADFARILAAVDIVLGTEGFDRYTNRGEHLAAEALTADPFIVAMATRLRGPWEGTSADLLHHCAPLDIGARLDRDWPANARSVTTLLKRQGPTMRRAGWTVTELPAGHANVVQWQIAPPPAT